MSRQPFSRNDPNYYTYTYQKLRGQTINNINEKGSKCDYLNKEIKSLDRCIQNAHSAYMRQ